MAARRAAEGKEEVWEEDEGGGGDGGGGNGGGGEGGGEGVQISTSVPWHLFPVGPM